MANQEKWTTTLDLSMEIKERLDKARQVLAAREARTPSKVELITRALVAFFAKEGV